MAKIQGIYERIPIAVDMFRFTGSVLYDTTIGSDRITEVVCGKTAVVVFELPPTLSKIPEGTIVHVSCPKIEFKVLDLVYHPDQPQVVKHEVGMRWRTCKCGDAFFPANRDTSEKSCATCTMLDKIQIDENLKEMRKFTTKKSQDFTNTDSKAVVELRQGVIDLIRQNYDVEIKPFQIITEDFVDKLFTKDEL